MFTRLLTFNGANDIDRGVEYLREQVLPILNDQRGFLGVSASADRPGHVLVVLSLWNSEKDRAASDGTMSKARDEATSIVGGTLTIEHFEQIVREVVKPLVPGCALMVTRASMDPASVDRNIEFFKGVIAPQIKAQPGFCALRNMIDRQTGRGVVSSAWEDRAAMEASAAQFAGRRAMAASMGVMLEDPSFRELLLSQVK